MSIHEHEASFASWADTQKGLPESSPERDKGEAVFPHNPAHPAGTCGDCGEEMAHNVPRMGPSGGFIHKSTGRFECASGLPEAATESVEATRQNEPRVKTLLRSILNALDHADSDTYWLTFGMLLTAHQELIGAPSVELPTAAGAPQVNPKPMTGTWTLHVESVIKENERLTSKLRAAEEALRRPINGWTLREYLDYQFPATRGHMPLQEWLDNAEAVLSPHKTKQVT